MILSDETTRSTAANGDAMPKILASLATLLCLLAVPPAATAAFPDKPVRIVVPFPPGGGTDAFARIMAAELSKAWGQQVIIDNRAGAQGNVGTLLALRSPADGYTMLLAHQGVLTINAHMYDKIGFDPIADVMAVSLGTQQPFVLAAHPSVPVTTLAELTALAKREPGKLTFASSSSGPQMTGEMYRMAAGVDMLHVPYKGAGPAITDLLAGHVNTMFANPTSVAPHVRSGKLRGLAVFGPTRIDAMPDVPTAAEAGYPQLGRNPEWYGLAVPTGTPAAIVAKLNADIVAALKTEHVREAIRALGMTASPSTPEAFAAQIRTDNEVWGKVVKASGAKAE
jgi:tripartite-type tricarboxylate transporter receptor subunit TctC